MNEACKAIHTKTGDAVHHHETFGGDWSVSAVLQALRARNFEVYRAVKTRENRSWSGPSMDELLNDESFKGVVLHQPVEKHFTCIRPEKEGNDTNLYYVDSQSSGPRRISSRLATRRCLANAYAWEPFVVRGDDIEYVPAPSVDLPEVDLHRRRQIEKPSEEFLKEWRAFNQEQ